LAESLDRFVEAQAGVFDQALKELRAGRKQSHWMWFVFPQLRGLGFSDMAQRFGIANLAGAQAYLAHPLLGPRLHACGQAVLDWAGCRTPVQVFGAVDALKLCSSMTLFEAAGGEPEFGQVLDAMYAGARDGRTLEILARD
jgi:uncharacterized protein (DUF1810 family)